MRNKRLISFLKTGAIPEFTALDESLAEHDRRFHGGRFDAATMTCGMRKGASWRDKGDSLACRKDTRSKVDSTSECHRPTVGSMVKALKDWVPGIQVEEVDQNLLHDIISGQDPSLRFMAFLGISADGIERYSSDASLKGLTRKEKEKMAIQKLREFCMSSQVVVRGHGENRTMSINARDRNEIVNKVVNAKNRPIPYSGEKREIIATGHLADILEGMKKEVDEIPRHHPAWISVEVFSKVVEWDGVRYKIEAKVRNDQSGSGLYFIGLFRQDTASRVSSGAVNVSSTANNGRAADSRWLEVDSFNVGTNGRNSQQGSSTSGIVTQGTKDSQGGNLSIIGNGKVAGCYNRKTGRVSLVKGVATPATVAHEIAWHATFHWTEKNHPELHKKLLEYAKSAPDGVRQSVRERYAGIDLSPEALLDEIGAERFTREDLSPLLDAVAKKQAEGWFDDVEDLQDEARSKFVKGESNSQKAPVPLPKAELDRIAELSPKQAVGALVLAMIKGKSLGRQQAE